MKGLIRTIAVRKEARGGKQMKTTIMTTAATLQELKDLVILRKSVSSNLMLCIIAVSAF